MTKLQLLCFAAMISTIVATAPNTSSGRGFGGMHGGGMRGGMGMRGGGMNMGMGGAGMGMRGGGFGGARPGGANFGGARPGGATFGGAGNLGGGRPGVPSFGGSRPGGFSPGGGIGGNRGPIYGGSGPGQTRPGSLGGNNANRFGGPGAGRFPGGSAGGFAGNRRGPEAAGGLREPGAGGLGERQNRGDLGKFLGLPSDGGLHAAGANRLGMDHRGLKRYPDADLRRRGDYVRRDFRGRDFYSTAWYRRYPGAWYPRAWAYGDVWAAATWDYMNDWFGYGDAQPMYYDYGNNVTYQDNSVYVNGQDTGTSDEYYEQAQTLANTGTTAQTTDDQQWLSLGVFAMSHDQQTKANMILQLAVNKQGTIRGNYTATMTNETKPVHGSVDKKTQKAAWTVGDNTDNVMETGIYNLTKDEAPALVHFGKDKTEQWLLVRVKQDDGQKQEQQEPEESPF